MIAAIAAILLALESWVLFHMRRQCREIEARVRAAERRAAAARLVRSIRQRTPRQGLAGLPAGSLLNDCELPDLRGRHMTFSQWRGQRIAVVFIQPDCPYSARLIASIAADSAINTAMQLIFVTTGDVEGNRELVASIPAGIPVLLQDGIDLAHRWRVPETPGGYLIDASGVTETEILRGESVILKSLGLTAGDGPTGATPLVPKLAPFPKPIPPGSPAPVDAIPLHPCGSLNLAGQTYERTLIVFSDPGCAPCRVFAPVLAAETRRLPERVNLVMLSRGSDEANLAFVRDFTPPYPISFQRDGKLSRAFGVVDTPAAMLVNGDGTIAAEPAVGSAAILALIKRAAPRAHDAPAMGR